MMLRRVPIDIDGQHFCMLIVDENKTYVRMWLCEIGPKISEGPEVEYCITVPFPSVQVQGNPSVTYKFRNQIFLHGDETGDRFGYLELTKDFLKSVGEVFEDGQVQFRIFIQFMKYES
ncbi:unnamed protein product [Orchesella dallaii]|uniref:Uncharacterized protein n=1 Tax=Orchesella dallaii TaxID=48710 RepID=A0ABP1Q8E1_9HEXA